MKKVDKKEVGKDLKRTLLEVEALQLLSDHPHICALYQSLETEKYILLVLERCKGDLFDLIVKHKRLQERVSMTVFWQIVSAVEYIHTKGFAHRDLRPVKSLRGTLQV